MSSFTTPLIVSPLSSGNDWKLIKSFTYRIDSKYSNRFIRVPSNFKTDFASIPKILFWLLPWWAKFNKASVLHDWLYKTKKIMGSKIERKQADNIWLEAMFIEFRNHQNGHVIALMEYKVVRAFAWLAWR